MPLPFPEPNPQQVAAALDKFDIIEPERMIFEMGRTRLRRHFKFRTTRNIDAARLISSLIWQDLGSLRQGQLEPFEGNIRSYWYARVKPTLDRSGARAKTIGRGYKLMINKFSEFVGDHRLFAYREFGFGDGDAHLRHLGDDNPHIVVAGEKEGQLVLLRQLAQRFGCTTIALGGQPSILATEYFASAMADAGLGRAHLVILTIVDFDPAGDSIANSFLNQLRRVGFEGDLTRLDIVHPSRMTHRQLDLNKFNLGTKADTRTERQDWIARTGGLGPFGRRWGNYGVEADAMTTQQVFDAFVELTASHIQISVEDIELRRIKKDLAKVLEQLLLQRLLGPRL